MNLKRTGLSRVSARGVSRRFGSLAFVLMVVISLLGASCLGMASEPKSLVRPYYVWPRAGAQHVSLDGTWQLGYADNPIEDLAGLKKVDEWFPAAVPSSVQWALHRAGKLPNPYEHLNSRLYRWVTDKIWYYRRQFEVPSSARDQYVFLCFDGIDYFSKVWLNGTLLGRSEGMFGGPEVEVSEHLHYGPGATNELIVEVGPGNMYGIHSFDPVDAQRKVIIPWGIAGGFGSIVGGGGDYYNLMQRGGHLMVVPSPIDIKEFFPVGIWRSVRLEVVPRVHMERPYLVTEEATAENARLKLSVEVDVNIDSTKTDLHSWNDAMLSSYRDSLKSAVVEDAPTLRIQLLDPASPAPVWSEDVPLHIYEGRNWVSHDIHLKSAKLWWPNGMGDPNLYRVRLALVHGGNETDRTEFDYGIRTIKTVPTTGPRTLDNWHDWQFIVNGRPLFVKGANWWTVDILLDLPRERYAWLLKGARDEGLQILRVNGAGYAETDDFYTLCDHLGLMVWHEFPLGNSEDANWPQDVWEAQVLHLLFSLRNHSSIALYSGGNEFNPYSLRNATMAGILERSIAIFDPTRIYRRTSPDGGDVHMYPDMDPTWYSHLLRFVPFLSETGLLTFSEPQGILKVVTESEMQGPLRDILMPSFATAHPEFVNHFMEYYTNANAKNMLHRASQFIDISGPDLNALSTAAQAASAEYLQIISDGLQANYPVTVGFMPWVFNTPWPVEFFMLVDAFGQPVAPYYFLKRTYEPTHVLAKMPHLLWAAGEEFPVQVTVVHAQPESLKNLVTSVEIFDVQFHSLWRKQAAVDAAPGPSVKTSDLGAFTLPASLRDHFFFVVAELRDAKGKLLSRSDYWPRCLSRLDDAAFRRQYRAEPSPSLVFEHGPWLMAEVAPTKTTLDIQLVSRKQNDEGHTLMEARIRNSGATPAFYTHINVEGERAFFASDNYFWLAPGEKRLVSLEVKWDRPEAPHTARLTVEAWNALRQGVAVTSSPSTGPRQD